MGFSATLMKRDNSGDVLCNNLPSGCRPFSDPVVVRGGGLPHTQANGYHDNQPMCCQTSGSRVATEYGAGWRVFLCWKRKVSWRPPVKQANGLDGAVSVCSRRKAGTCMPPQRKGRAHYSKRKGNGQRRPDGEHNVVDAPRGYSTTSATPVSKSHKISK